MRIPRVGTNLQTSLITAAWLMCFQSGMASDDLHDSSRVGALGIPLVSYERIPIGAVLAYPDRYQMREIRLTGTVAAMQTETVTNRRACGRAYEQTTLIVEDASGMIQVIDQGACGRNASSLKAPALKVGQQVDLLVLITIPTSSDAYGSSVEATIRFLDLARD